MKIAILFTLLLMFYISMLAQDDCIDKYVKLHTAFESLKSENSNLKASIDALILSSQSSLLALKDSNNQLTLQIKQLEQFKLNKKTLDAKLILKTDSIHRLKLENYKNKQILVDNESECKERLKKEFRLGEESLKQKFIQVYKNMTFEELVMASSMETINAIEELLGTRSELASKLNDLRCYFEAKEKLKSKFNSDKVKYSINHLKSIQQQSTLVTVLNQNLEDYEIINSSLKACLTWIHELDSKEKVAEMNKDIKDMKYTKIVIQIQNFIFSNDYNFGNYLHLDAILIELIKAKQGDPDFRVDELLNNL